MPNQTTAPFVPICRHQLNCKRQTLSEEHTASSVRWISLTTNYQIGKISAHLMWPAIYYFFNIYAIYKNERRWGTKNAPQMYITKNILMSSWPSGHLFKINKCNHIELLNVVFFFTVIRMRAYKYIRKSCLSFHWHCTYSVYCNCRDIFDV